MIGDAILTNNSNPEQHMYNVCIEIHVIYVYIQYLFFFKFSLLRFFVEFCWIITSIQHPYLSNIV